MAMLPSPILPVPLPHGLALWTLPNSGTITHEERKTETETEIETETERETETGTEKESGPERGSGSGITAPPPAFSTVMKSDTDTGNMRKEAMSAIELVGKKKNDTENDVTERRKKVDRVAKMSYFIFEFVSLFCSLKIGGYLELIVQ